MGLVCLPMGPASAVAGGIDKLEKIPWHMHFAAADGLGVGRITRPRECTDPRLRPLQLSARILLDVVPSAIVKPHILQRHVRQVERLDFALRLSHIACGNDMSTRKA